ncbi:protein of unknown function [Candidatus Methylomirabilis oxygeniifera]|uniref:Uncharacterized protein n=1 Tax=Methylomirabilis oxygeniifera TaxID=671143 RepID=D5MLI1_METO1|nr:protein of unknown function [Candidatus Methylomirabilis oxyfera]
MTGAGVSLGLDSVMHWVAFVSVAVGLALSLAAFIHDARKLRVTRACPQAAPKRVAPKKGDRFIFHGSRDWNNKSVTFRKSG